MDRQGEKHIGTLIDAVMASNPLLAEGYCKQKIKSSWKDVAGEFVANATENISINGRKMYVKINSAIIRSEIMMIRSQLTYKLNQAAGRDTIDEIIVR